LKFGAIKRVIMDNRGQKIDKIMTMKTKQKKVVILPYYDRKSIKIGV